jgi:hypothetical protein
MAIDLVKGKDVEKLNNHDLRAILNALLQNESAQNHVPIPDLDLTCRETDPDAGIDARIKWPAALAHDLFRVGDNVLQYKSGNLTAEQLKAEFAKPGVQKALKSGGTYLMCVGRDLVPNTADEHRKLLKKLCKNRRIPSNRATIIFGSGLARWITRYPALQAFPALGKQILDYATVERWRTDNSQLSNPFHADESRTETIKKIRDFLDDTGGGAVLRLEGPAGVGKTRLALEALADPKYATRALYAPNADNSEVQPFLSAVYSSQEAKAIAVVDECDETKQMALGNYAENSKGRLKLVCIGIADVLHETPPLQLTQIYQLKPLGDTDIEVIVRSAYGSAPKELVDATVRLASGYVKLAMFIASVFDKGGAQSPLKLKEVFDIRVFLQKFVPEKVRKSLQVLALLARIGWEEELRVEAEVVAEFVNLPFDDLEFAVKRLKEQGVVVPRGRYLYVSPDLLALKAAADLWDVKGAKLIGLIEKLKGLEPRRQLLRRLAGMGEHPEVRKAVEGILSNKGLYPSLKELNDPFLSEVLRILSSALPVQAVDLLTQQIVGALREELLSFDTGRRDVIWALESLVRWPETSIKAARVLMELAISETEKIANNATAIFKQFFHVFLSGSPVPLMDRFALIDELLSNNDSESRMLAARAASAALEGHESRMGGEIDYLSKKTFPPEWKPKTYGEIWQCRRRALEYLELISQGSDEAAEFARHERLGSVFALLQHGQVEDAISLLESAVPKSDEERRMVMDSCSRISEVPDLPDAFRERVKQIKEGAFGKTYFDRLRRWIGRRPHSDFDNASPSGFAAADKKVIQLAEEGFQEGVSGSGLAWLSSPEAENVWLFGKRLGELDADEKYFDLILQRASDDVNCMLLASYIWGRGMSSGEQNREVLLDKVASQKPITAFGATWRGDPTEAGAERIVRLISEGAVPGSALRMLQYGGWVEKLPSHYALKIVDLMLSFDAVDNIEAILGIIDHAVRTERMTIEQFGDAPWRALEAPIAARSPNFDWHWGRVADLVATRDPSRFARIFITLFEKDETWLSTDSAQGILRKVTEADPDAVWSIISPVLLRGDSTTIRLSLKLRHWFGELIPPETLVRWARSQGRRGFLLAASLINGKSANLSNTAKMLVREAPNPKEVLNQIAANLGSCAFTGLISSHMEREVEVLRAWAKDPEPKFRAWARAALTYAEKGVRRQKLLEEEEEY